MMDIAQAYLDLLGRPGSPEEIAWWNSVGGASAENLAAIQNSPEAQSYVAQQTAPVSYAQAPSQSSTASPSYLGNLFTQGGWDNVYNLINQGQFQSAFDTARQYGFTPEQIAQNVNATYGTQNTAESLLRDYGGVQQPTQQTTQQPVQQTTQQPAQQTTQPALPSWMPSGLPSNVTDLFRNSIIPVQTSYGYSDDTGNPDPNKTGYTAVVKNPDGTVTRYHYDQMQGLLNTGSFSDYQTLMDDADNSDIFTQIGDLGLQVAPIAFAVANIYNAINGLSAGSGLDSLNSFDDGSMWSALNGAGSSSPMFTAVNPFGPETSQLGSGTYNYIGSGQIGPSIGLTQPTTLDQIIGQTTGAIGSTGAATAPLFPGINAVYDPVAGFNVPAMPTGPDGTLVPINPVGTTPPTGVAPGPIITPTNPTTPATTPTTAPTTPTTTPKPTNPLGDISSMLPILTLLGGLLGGNKQEDTPYVSKPIDQSIVNQYGSLPGSASSGGLLYSQPFKTLSSPTDAFRRRMGLLGG